MEQTQSTRKVALERFSLEQHRAFPFVFAIGQTGFPPSAQTRLFGSHFGCCRGVALYFNLPGQKYPGKVLMRHNDVTAAKARTNLLFLPDTREIPLGPSPHPSDDATAVGRGNIS